MRCPKCNDLWKTDTVWTKLKKEVMKDVLVLLHGLKWEKSKDFRLKHYTDGHNQALKDVEQKLKFEIRRKNKA